MAAPKFDPSTRHSLYTKWMPKWFRQRCLLEGEDRIKEMDVAEEFLPRLEGQNNQSRLDIDSNQVISSYESYKNRAVLFNATSRTRDGLVGAVMRKEPELIWEGSDDELDHLGHGLESFSEIVNDTLDEVIGTGRYGQLVDVSNGAADNEPFIASYHGESITDWEEAVVAGRKRLIRVNLKEKGPIAKDGRELERYRILKLGIPTSDADAALTETPVYFQEVWVEVEATKGAAKTWVRELLVVPTALGGATFDEIPFTFFNTKTTRAKPEKPALLDIAVVNIGHYRNSADKEHGLHFTGLPQPWLAGFKFKSHLFIGSGAAWVSEDPNAKAGYLEVQSDFKALTDEMDNKKKDMAALGGRLLEEQTPAGSQEAKDTVKLRHSGSNSVLARISLTVSEGLTRAMRFVRRFKGDDSNTASVRLNLDFGTENLDPATLTALMTAVQQGMMSWDTFVYNLKQGELYPDDWDQEKEAAAIKVGVPGRSLDELLNPKPDPTAAVPQAKPKSKPKKKAKAVA